MDAILALLGDLPVGWCSFGPATSFPRLKNSRALARPRSDGVWSVICFYIPSKYRRLGLATRLLGAARERAFALGASEVEGFPVDPQSPEIPVPAAFAWTGVTAMFDAAGFRPVLVPIGRALSTHRRSRQERERRVELRSERGPASPVRDEYPNKRSLPGSAYFPCFSLSASVGSTEAARK